MKKDCHILHNESGQSMVEYILTLALSLGIIFLFIQLAVNMSSGYVAHYVSYATSRVYLTYDNAGEAATYRRAEEEARKKLDSLKVNEAGLSGLEFKVNHLNRMFDRHQKLYAGTIVKFRRKMSPFQNITGKKIIHYISESFLGKEPLRRSCLKAICENMKLKTRYNQCEGYNNGHHTLYDNGC